MVIDVPAALVASYRGKEDAWLAGLPAHAAAMLERWELRRDGRALNGVAGLVLPVIRPDGTPAVLKLQPVNEENAGIVPALRAWRGDGIVRLLDHDPDTGALLLERLQADRPLTGLADADAAVGILAGLLARLVAVPAPPEVRRLADIGAAMVAQVPDALPALPDAGDRRLVQTCAAVTADLLGEPGDRLLHWDLHYNNILAGHREPWLAIDPVPLAGDPGFELLPALDNRWDDAVATGDPARAVLRRLDRLTEVLGLDRQRAAGWTLARVLQNTLWSVEDGATAVDPVQAAIAGAVLSRHRDVRRV
jgi:streptomycin 6-kinase